MKPQEAIYTVVISAVIGMALASAYVAWSKPDCRAGYVAVSGMTSGWVCVPGYKPESTN